MIRWLCSRTFRKNLLVSRSSWNKRRRGVITKSLMALWVKSHSKKSLANRTYSMRLKKMTYSKRIARLFNWKNRKKTLWDVPSLLSCNHRRQHRNSKKLKKSSWIWNSLNKSRLIAKNYFRSKYAMHRNKWRGKMMSFSSYKVN